MLIRLPLAFFLGLILYIVAHVVTYGYDGFITVVGLPVVGGIMTVICLLGLNLIGCPLLFPKVWVVWRRMWWASVVLLLAGVAALCLSWHPALRIMVEHPEFHDMVPSFEPALAMGGWALILFSVSYGPLIGVRGDNRWV